MNVQHTPGPWQMSHAGEGRAGGKFAITEYYVRLPGADFALAADIVDGNMKPSEANARLIAATPELLRACEAMSAHYSGSLDHQPAYVRLARVALAKALGK